MSPHDRRVSRVSRRRLLAGGALATATTSGCITTGIDVRSDLSESGVFRSITLMESWTANQATATVTLTERATREANVRELAVIDPSGSSVWTGKVQPAQTSVSNVMLPVGGSVTLAAADASGKFVEQVTITVAGKKWP
jgi:hypothetical protein